jgi:hypothetical protein
MDPPDHWVWAGPNWRDKVHRDVVGEIVGVDLQTSNTEELAKRWSAILDAPYMKMDDRYMIYMSSEFVRIVPDTNGRGDGICALHIEVNDIDELTQRVADHGLTMQYNSVEMCGTTFHFVKESNDI